MGALGRLMAPSLGPLLDVEGDEEQEDEGGKKSHAKGGVYALVL